MKAGNSFPISLHSLTPYVPAHLPWWVFHYNNDSDDWTVPGNPLGSLEKTPMPEAKPDQLNQNVWGWGPASAGTSLDGEALPTLRAL
jgi:hypothetical protein